MVLDAQNPEQWASVFRAVRDRDMQEKRGSQEILHWTYMERSRKPSEHEGFLLWKGPECFYSWIYCKFEGSKKPPDQTFWKRPKREDVDALIQKSGHLHDFLLKKSGNTFDIDHRNKDVYNAQDYHYCVSLVPELQSVLEFGPGSGRELFLFKEIPQLKFFALDAVEQPYLLQYWVCKELHLPLWEYLEHSEDASVAHVQNFIEGEPKDARVIHLPTWRSDLIPDRSIDLVMFVWCLSEMSSEAAQHALQTVKRVLRPGGFVYIRDFPHTRSYAWNPERTMRRMGFRLVYYPWKQTEEEIHAVPRLYRLVQGEKHISHLTHLRSFRARNILGKITRAGSRILDRIG